MAVLAESTENVFLAPGLHPAYADQWTTEAEHHLRILTSDPKVVAIGEIGLDATVDPPLWQQEMVLRAQLRIALESDLPVLLHVRQATGQLFDILRELKIGQQVGGIWHAFSASLEVAEEVVLLGFKIGVGPTLLRDNAKRLPAAVEVLPPSALVLETDFPDMTENPDDLLGVAKKVAELRGWTLAEVARITTENADRVLHFQDK